MRHHLVQCGNEFWVESAPTPPVLRGPAGKRVVVLASYDDPARAAVSLRAQGGARTAKLLQKRPEGVE